MSQPLALHDQLLAQARHLAQKDRRKPFQASLRRSISAAYYALFHRLASESAFSLAGSSAADTALQRTLVRAFQHGQMKNVCKWFAGGTGSLPDYIRTLPQARIIPAELQAVARAFVNLQEDRHLADYSVITTFVRADALQSVTMAEAAFQDWNKVRRHAATRLFLLLLLIGDGMKPRS